MIQQFIFVPIFIVLLAPYVALGANTPDKVQQKMTKAIQTESKAQAKADDWEGQKEDLVNEIRDLQTRLTWLKYQKKKHEIYVQGVKESINDLEARKLEARMLRESLEPYLEEVVFRLEAFIPEDLPFLKEERQLRLYFLQNTLNDYHLDLGEKLRRVFEALSVEATYGKMVMASDETLSVDGVDTEVTIFRLGRLTMYYQSIDGQKIGIFNPDSGQWEPLDKRFARDIRRALEMARRERTVQLIHLPVGALTQ